MRNRKVHREQNRSSHGCRHSVRSSVPLVMIVVLSILASATAATGQALRPRPEWPLSALQRERAIQEAHQEALLELPGVKGIGITVAGEKPALLVLIGKGHERPLLPDQIEGMPVVVEENVEMSLADGGTGCLPCHNEPYSPPVPMGASTSSGAACDAGTLGFRACDSQTGKVGYVTAWHVATRGANGCPGVAGTGTPQYHRGRYDVSGCGLENQVGTLLRTSLIRPYPQVSYADAAFVESTTSQTSRSILDLGFPAVVSGSPVLNSCVRKSGRTTGSTWGLVEAVNLTVDVSDSSCPSFQGRFFPVFRIAGSSSCPKCTGNTICHPFGIGGDSGAAVLGSQSKIVGLLFALGNAGRGLASNADFVLSQLNVLPEGSPYCP